MANPQPEPFVKFSKELFDALLLSPMPATHKEIVLAVIRRTYGDHGKKQAAISHSLLRRMTGRADSGIRRCLTALCAEGVIRKVQPATFQSPAVFALNKDYESWGRWSIQSATRVAEGQELAEGHDGDSGDRQTLAEGSATRVAEGSATTVAPLKILEIFEDLGEPTDGSSPPENTQHLVGHYVAEHRRLGLSEPSRQRVGQAAKAIKERVNAGVSPPTIAAALTLAVERAKSPAMLDLLIAEVEKPPPKRRQSNADRALALVREMEGEVRL